MQKVAIVDGATSFIGLALIRELQANHYDVYAVVRPNSNRRNLLCLESNGVLHTIECELSKVSEQPISFDNRGLIKEYYHIGWSSDFENPRFNRIGQMQNVKYTEDTLRTAAEIGCKRFVAIGSQAECGLVTSPINSLTPDNPITAYAEAKCEAYAKGRALSKELGIEFYWPRLLSAYGPYDRPHTLIMSCIDACMNHKRISMSAAEQIWDYVYVKDVAKALRLISEKGQPCKRYSIATGVGRPLKEYIEIIADVYEYPELMNGIGERPYSDNEVMYLVGDVSEIEDDTGMVFDSNFDRNIREMRAADC